MNMPDAGAELVLAEAGPFRVTLRRVPTYQSGDPTAGYTRVYYVGDREVSSDLYRDALKTAQFAAAANVHVKIAQAGIGDGREPEADAIAERAFLAEVGKALHDRAERIMRAAYRDGGALARKAEDLATRFDAWLGGRK
jgi:hypothetical protein